jgi:hypothetical protein
MVGNGREIRKVDRSKQQKNKDKNKNKRWKKTLLPDGENAAVSAIMATLPQIPALPFGGCRSWSSAAHDHTI